MHVRTYLIALVLGCCSSGLGLFLAVEYLHGKSDMISAEESRLALTLRDMDRFEASMRQWIVMSDLILGSNETYLVDGALNLAGDLRQLFESLDGALPPGVDAEPLDTFLTEHTRRLEQTSETFVEGRGELMNRLLLDMDEQVPLAAETLDSIRAEIEARYQAYRERHLALSGSHYRKVAGLLCGFFGIVLIQWRWISRMLTIPIRSLKDEAQRAIASSDCDKAFNVSDSGPREVQDLSVSFSNLVGDLDTQIQNHKRTQIERKRLNEELVDASRKAGMAEVASGVIHNVGNTLNSINTSVGLLRETTKHSFLPRLVQAKDVLKTNENRLPQYFQEDRKGKLYPAMLSQVTEQLCNEREICIKELASIEKHLDHIKQIISMQQDYAKPAKAEVVVSVRELVSEALEISKSPASDKTIRYDVAVADVSLTTDRHKVLQVLVNLFVNAAESIQEQSGAGTVSIRTGQAAGFVRIEVQDTGVGVTRDNLAKIFQHGFTTKSSGYGFGLHASALAAQQLGGTLSVSSDGPQQGATFTLSLPHTTAEPCQV